MSVSPAQYPKIGDFYYHYKHKKAMGLTDFAYKIISIGLHTETEEILVIYKPLYKKNTEKSFETFVRPLEMFLGNVDNSDLNYHLFRFNLIKDKEIINKLRKIL